MKITDASVKAYLTRVRRIARMYGVRVYLGRGKRVWFSPAAMSNGYFDGHTLAVATGKPIEAWVPILMHEDSHMDQWIERERFFSEEYDYSAARVDEWLLGMDHPDIISDINRALECECDCEHRAFKKIAVHNLPIDPEAYARKANAYLIFHAWMAKNRRWYNRAPYEIAEVLAVMPTEIISRDQCTVEQLNKYDLTVFDRCL